MPIDYLIAGYRKFRTEEFPSLKDHFHLLASSQSPEVLFITCADSRVVPSLILQTEPGDLFLCRNAGNIVPPFGQFAGGTSATIEYAVEVLGVKHIILCGHSDCGACKAALAPEKIVDSLPLTSQWLHFIEAAWDYLDPAFEDPEKRKDEEALHTALIHANIRAQVAHLKTHPEIIRGLASGKLEVHGWYYDILSGSLEVWNEEKTLFEPLDGQASH